MRSHIVFVLLLVFFLAIQAVDRNKFKSYVRCLYVEFYVFDICESFVFTVSCDHNSWCKRQRNLRSDQVHYTVESELGTIG
jgi:hypothetical protein